MGHLGSELQGPFFLQLLPQEPARGVGERRICTPRQALLGCRLVWGHCGPQRRRAPTPGVSVHPCQSSLRAITLCCSRTLRGSPLPSPPRAHCCRRPGPAPTHRGCSAGRLPLLGCARRLRHLHRRPDSGELPGSPRSLCALHHRRRPGSTASPLSLLSPQLPPLYLQGPRRSLWSWSLGSRE